ncbi:DUF11 domain-containing protein [Microbacterium sp. G2-8]|uniref:DUF7927 domain-containing protein n=1 Tax=Microbacterium sp. G2-8 TaxID=2842454 RepID=UPI0021A9C8DE
MVGGLLGAAGVLGVAQPALAVAGDPFLPDSPTVLVAQESPSQLYRAETTGDGSFDFTPEGTLEPGVEYNAIGFNPADNYLYGIVQGGDEYPIGTLVRVGQDGTEPVRTAPYQHPNGSTRFFVGAFNPADGLYYVADSGVPDSTAPQTTVLAINVVTGAVVNTIDLGVGTGVQDFAFKDGYAWGAASDGSLHRIDVITGALDIFPGVLPASGGGYGAAWTFGNGNLGVSANDSGVVTQLVIEDGASANPSFFTGQTVPGPSSNRNDGTSIPGLPADLSIEKTGAATFTSGDSVTYDITVTNNGPGVSSGWQMTDTIPDGLSNPVFEGDVQEDPDSFPGELRLNGGRLEAGTSTTISITFDTETAPGECVENNVSIFGNEEDDNADNNQDSAIACDPVLDIEKTSNATPDSRPGDIIEYTVTATNNGEGDYTAENPAFVFDDLSAVIEDGAYQGDVTADRPGVPSVDGDLLSWSGPLASTESVEITYSVELMAGGDGDVTNVAWEPNDPEETESPECDPADENGRDPVTGEPCAVVQYELPRLTIEKAADTTELPLDGQQVEYTVRVTNEGPGNFTADAPATLTDDLTDVLDSATFNGDEAATVGEVGYAEPELTWEGVLAAGEFAEITYSVDYSAEGDNELINTACVPETLVLPGAEACDTVRIPGADLEQWKTAETTDSPAVAGSVLTYTLHFSNDGQSTAAVDAVDDLTHVLDDAEVTLAPESSDGLTAELDGNRIAVTGDVPAGETYTVVYEVTVKADGERGDDLAANFLFEGPPPETPPEPVCEPTDSELPDCTLTPIAAVEYSKQVEASTDPVEAGTVLTYTITIDSIGEATTPVSREDVLTSVLDDAELLTQPASDTDSVTVTDVVDGRFEIAGELAGGESATVTYEVTVLPDDERGNNSADNFLVPPGEDPPPRGSCEEADPECTSTPIPLITAAKSVDPESGSMVVAGQEVTYTLTFANDGTATGSVDYVDDLTGVLDDAALTAGPTVSDDALGVERSGDAFVVEGDLQAGQTVTVVYTVTVLPDFERGDNRLGNVLADSDTPDPECGDDGVSCTENPIPQLDAWKSVEADSTPVAEGTTLTYTLFFENSGQAPAAVDFTDDLTHVVDDADVTVEPTSTNGLEVERDGVHIFVSGEVPAGDTRTVTYEVTMKADEERGDDIAANFLLEGPPPEEPPLPVCQPTDAEHPDCTMTPVGHLLTSKAVEASSDPVTEGTELTYTLTFDNQGEGAAIVDHEDDLSGVLDDAELSAAPEASADALSVSDVENGTFGVTGELAAGQTVTVTYTVTVLPESERGDNVADNFLVPEGEEPPSGGCEESDPNCTTTPMPVTNAQKASDPDSGETVQPGQDVTYTLTFSNTGQAPGEVDYTDDLTNVLDDAVLTSAPETSDSALAATSGEDGAIRVTGSLEAGQTVTVTYVVTIGADGERGDDRLANVVLPSGEEPDAECAPEDDNCTVHYVPEISDEKSVDPVSGTPVVTGQELTYTLTFRNDGAAIGTVEKVDDLSHLLDDAEVISEPRTSDDALTAVRDGARIMIDGALEPGQVVTVSYTVLVKESGERGDDILANFLIRPDVEEVPTPECVPGEGEFADCTTNPIGDIVPSKSVDPESGTTVIAGDELTYTLSFENTGQAPAAVDYTDHMDGVLDDAALSGEIAADDGLTVAGPENGKLHVTGEVPAGATLSVTYTIVVNAYDDQGDHQLANFLTLASEDPQDECGDADPLCTENPIDPAPVVDPPAPGPDLPNTGGTVAFGAIGAAVLALLLGGGLMLISRRRSAEAHDII